MSTMRYLELKCRTKSSVPWSFPKPKNDRYLERSIYRTISSSPWEFEISSVNCIHLSGHPDVHEVPLYRMSARIYIIVLILYLGLFIGQRHNALLIIPIFLLHSRCVCVCACACVCVCACVCACACVCVCVAVLRWVRSSCHMTNVYFSHRIKCGNAIAGCMRLILGKLGRFVWWSLTPHFPPLVFVGYTHLITFLCLLRSCIYCSLDLLRSCIYCSLDLLRSCIYCSLDLMFTFPSIKCLRYIFIAQPQMFAPVTNRYAPVTNQVCACYKQVCAGYKQVCAGYKEVHVECVKKRPDLFLNVCDGSCCFYYHSIK